MKELKKNIVQKFLVIKKFEKIKNLEFCIITLMTLPMAIIAYFFLHFLNIFRPVRIGTLNSKGRLSIMIAYIEPYVRKLNLEGFKNPLVIVINPGNDPNEQLTKMYKRKVLLLDDKNPILRRTFTTVRYIAAVLNSKIHAKLKSGHTKEFRDAWQKGKSILAFTENEKKKGKELLKKLGIPPGVEYICVGLRESSYYQQFLDKKGKAKYFENNQVNNKDAESDTYIRNPPLSNYIPMMMDCANKGLYVLRMGQFIDNPLPEKLHPKIIDYASKHRTPFLDVFLLAHCKFVVAGGAPGIWWFSTAFNKPVIQSDVYGWEIGGLRQTDLFLPKKLWFVKKKRFLTFKEMMKYALISLNYYAYESNCKKEGLQLIHNTPQEIIAVVREMNQRLEKKWEQTARDEKLQRSLRKLIPENIDSAHNPFKVGAEFLRQDKSFLN